MKIIHVNNYLRIIQRNETDYKIQTPIGVFQDINDAIEVYPEITENNRIRQCPICQKYFIKYGKTQNNKKYCSKECSDKYRRIYKNEYNRMWNRDKWLRDRNNTIISDYTNRSNNYEFHQNDTFWGLGSSHISETMNQDEETEKNTIRKELKRLGIKV